jgi:hypothetical protein
MAEILVSDLCDCRPLLLTAGFLLPRRDLPLIESSLFSMALAHCFFIVLHCSYAGGFFLARARPYIVIGAHFPLQIDCIFREIFRRGTQHQGGSTSG